MTGWGMLEGRLAPVDELSMPVTDRGLLLGDAVFETLRTYSGRLFELEAHLDRLEAGLRALHVAPAPPRGLLVDEVRALVRRAREEDELEQVVRITVTRGSGPRGLSTIGTGPPRRLLMAFPLKAPDDAWYHAGVAVMTAGTRRVALAAQDPRIKSTSALNLILARLEADAAGVEEALMCDARGHYLEATAANLVVLADGVYHAPRAEDGVLAGVTAARVFGILEDMGWRAARGPVAPDVLHGADEVWLTQTTREVIPVTRIDGEPVGAGVEGPVARQVRARFREEVARWLDS